MDATMTDATVTDSTHRPIGFGAAFTRQFRLLWTSLRPVIMGGGLLALLVLAGDPWMDDPKARLLTFWPLWLVLIGPLWAVAVFHNEGPSKRLYHWSLPVGRTRHTLARLAAGLAWLWLAFAVLIAVGAVMAALDGDLWQLGEISFAGWVNLFTGPLIGYLGVSILTVGSDYPIRWGLGIIFLFPLTLTAIDEWLGMPEVVRAIARPLGGEQWGLMRVILGELGEDITRLDQQLYRMMNPGLEAHGNALTIDYWWISTAGWVLLLLGLVTLMASRHPDTLPRIRRSR